MSMKMFYHNATNIRFKNDENASRERSSNVNIYHLPDRNNKRIKSIALNTSVLTLFDIVCTFLF